MLRGIISERSTELPSIVIGKLLKMAVEDKSVISLGPGEPDFTTPKGIITAARRALSEGYTHYSPPQGRLELRKAIAEKLKKDNKIDASPDDIIVTTGSTEGILLSLMTMVDPGEGVMITDPGFLAYRPTVEILNGMPLSVPLQESEGFEFNVDVMKRMIVPEKTNVLIMNTPSNPTGTVFSRSFLVGCSNSRSKAQLNVSLPRSRARSARWVAFTKAARVRVSSPSSQAGFAS